MARIPTLKFDLHLRHALVVGDVDFQQARKDGETVYNSYYGLKSKQQMEQRAAR